MEILKTAGLKKYYTEDTYEVRALDGVTFSVQEQEFVAVVGTSGCGKTTLLHMLGGLDVPTVGGVWIRGNSLRDMEDEERTVFRRRNIGFVFQQYNLVPALSVYENIVLPLRLDGADVDRELLQEVTELLGLADKLDRLPQTLSGGQQQRAAIARALMVKSAVLLADEPTGSLDSVTGAEVMKVLRSCAERFHQTVVMVTHQDEAAKMADRIIRMADGKITDITDNAPARLADGRKCGETNNGEKQI